MEGKPEYQVGLTGWQAGLDQRQRQEVELARLYARDFGHGTAGHNRLVLIDKLADLLDGFEMTDTAQPHPQHALSFHVLPVPYHSQHEADAQRYRKDCGPACIEMIGKYYRPDLAFSTDDIMTAITHGVDRSTYIAELQSAMLRFFNVTLERHDGATWEDLTGWVMDENKPVITLGHYGDLQTRMDRGYTAGHYVVVVGVDAIRYQAEVVERAIVHDPDYYNGLHGQGAFIPLVRDHFWAFWDGAYKDKGNPRRMALVPEVDNA